MPLVLRIKSYHRLAPDQETSKTLDAGRLTLGRGGDNDWTLPDPQKLVSKHHCVIGGADGHYELTDVSTNGVYINGAIDPVGPDTPAVLADGDRLQIGEYELEVELTSGAAAGAGKPALSAWETGETQPPSGPAPRPHQDIFGSAHAEPPPVDTFAPPPLPDDPAHHRLIGIEESERFTPARSTADHAPPTAEIFSPPRTVAPARTPPPPSPPASGEPLIPDDWDADWSTDDGATSEAEQGGGPLLGVPTPPAGTPVAETRPTATIPPTADLAGVPATEPPSTPPENETPQTPPRRHAASATGTVDAALAAFLDGAGIDPSLLPPALTAHPETFRRFGEIYRCMIVGTMELLAARRSIKNEFRLSQTTIRPQENNPLKFSLGADDAMLALLAPRGSSYMPAEAAFEEAFDDIKAHQLAMMAAMQSAFQRLLRRLNPETLENRVGNERGIASLLVSRKAQLWDAYVQKYQTLVEEAAEDLEDLFAREFAKAYEAQVDRMRTFDPNE